MSRFVNSIVLSLFFGLWFGHSALAEEMKCYSPDDDTRATYLEYSNQKVIEYMNRGYICQLLGGNRLDPQPNSITYRRGRASVTVTYPTPEKSADRYSSSSLESYEHQFSYQECVDMIRASNLVTPQVMRCYRKVAPEVLQGRPLTPEHAKLLTSDFTSEVALSEDRYSRPMFVSPYYSQLEAVRSCLEVRDQIISTVRGSPPKKIKQLVHLKNSFHRKTRITSDFDERKRLTGQLGSQIEAIIPALASVQKCSLDARRSSTGQIGGTGYAQMKSSARVKGIGKFDFSDDILAEAARIASKRNVVSGRAE